MAKHERKLLKQYIDFNMLIKLPLAAHVKRLGKKAIHLASMTQVLFGIYGKRWQDDKEISYYINEHWVKTIA